MKWKKQATLKWISDLSWSFLGKSSIWQQLVIQPCMSSFPKWLSGNSGSLGHFMRAFRDGYSLPSPSKWHCDHHHFKDFGNNSSWPIPRNFFFYHGILILFHWIILELKHLLRIWLYSWHIAEHSGRSCFSTMPLYKNLQFSSSCEHVYEINMTSANSPVTRWRGPLTPQSWMLSTCASLCHAES